jgi:hypothetical protein
MLKLADISQGGWTTVSEYQTHELADNSDDERRIFRAEARAMKNIREAQRKRSVLRRPASTIVQVPGAPIPGSSGQGNNATPRRPGCCFACGVPGHWRQECTAVKSNASASDVTGTTRSGQQPKISNELNKQVLNVLQ